MQLTPFNQSNWQKGQAAFQEGRTAEAVTLLQEAVQENPADAEIRKFFGAALAQAGRPQEAVNQLRKAVELAPQNAQIHFNLGVAQAMNGEGENAKASYYAALQLNPDYPQARDALAQMGAPLPNLNPPIETAPEQADDAFRHNDALTTHGPVPIVAKPGPEDYIKAIIAGGVAAIVGAVIWDKFTYYTGYELGILSIGIGFLVGLAINMVSGEKRGSGLQMVGAVMALCGMVLGYALLIVDGLRGVPVFANASPLNLLWPAITFLPGYFQENFISLIFVAIGVYQGWIMPAAPPSPTNHATT